MEPAVTVPNQKVVIPLVLGCPESFFSSYEWKLMQPAVTVPTKKVFIPLVLGCPESFFRQL
jgi:hypothetical protein